MLNLTINSSYINEYVALRTVPILSILYFYTNVFRIFSLLFIFLEALLEMLEN